MQLPERLRNLGIQPPPTEKVKVNLSDQKVNALADIVFTNSAVEKGA